MERSKWPVGFAVDPDLENVVPLSSNSNMAADEKSTRSEENSGDHRIYNSHSSSNSHSNSNSRSSSNSSSNFRGGRSSRGKAPIIRNTYRSPAGDQK